MINAVVVGKFIPFHAGHQALIQKAVDLSDHVDVIICVNPDDPYPPEQRTFAIYESFSHADLRVHIVDNIMNDEDTPRSNKAWADYTKAILGYHPDLVVASEKYAKGWAKQMNAAYYFYDLARSEYPVSGTLCRENSYKMRDYVPSPTARWLFPRVVVIGAESTGTTTLANDLGEHYNTVVVPEYGRMLGEAMVSEDGIIDPDAQDAAWDDARFSLTSRGQDAMEERYARSANGLLICDTDSLATAVWYEYAMKKKPISGVSGDVEMKVALFKAGFNMAKKHSLYILTWDDIPFQQDPLGTRTGENLRRWMTQRFRDILLYTSQNHLLVVGSREDRLAHAVKSIDYLLEK